MPQHVIRRVRQVASRRHMVLLGAAVCVLASVWLAGPNALAQVPPIGATADVRDAAGRLVASAEFREGRGEVLITLIFPSPPSLSGVHAVHIQEVGRCDGPDFLTAGADFNPTHKKHGRQNPDGPHVGDLPNVDLANNLATFNTSAPGATLGAGPGSLLGPNRTALVIYSGQDDQVTDPDGNSGTRIACGVISAVAPGTIAAPKPVAAAQPTGSASPVASPGPIRPVTVQPALSPTLVQPAPAKPGISPVPIVAAASPVPIVAGPTPPPSATQTDGARLGSGPAFVIAILGVGLIGAGYLLRRAR